MVVTAKCVVDVAGFSGCGITNVHPIGAVGYVLAIPYPRCRCDIYVVMSVEAAPSVQSAASTGWGLDKCKLATL